MSRANLPIPAGYTDLLKEIKARIRQAQTRAMLSVNAEMVHLYWDIGRIIDGRQQQEGWGAAVIPRLARQLKNELPEVKGFSERNIKRMLAFYRAYEHPGAIVPQAVAQLQPAQKVPQAAAQSPETMDSLLWLIPWGHHALLLNKVRELTDRLWYIQQTLVNGWTRNVLLVMIQSEAHRHRERPSLISISVCRCLSPTSRGKCSRIPIFLTFSRSKSPSMSGSWKRIFFTSWSVFC